MSKQLLLGLAPQLVQVFPYTVVVCGEPYGEGLRLFIENNNEF